MDELILRIGLAAGAILFPYCPVDEAIRVRIDPVENSVVAELGNTHDQESNTRRVKGEQGTAELGANTVLKQTKELRF